jgi:hypothetical protein
VSCYLTVKPLQKFGINGILGLFDSLIILNEYRGSGIVSVSFLRRNSWESFLQCSSRKLISIIRLFV